MVQYSSASLDRLFHALADPTRRAMLTRLARGTATVTDLAAPFPTSLNAVSKHLRVLERAGLVRRRIRGREHHCRLEPSSLRAADEWIASYRQYWTTRLEALDTVLTGAPNPSTRSLHASRPTRRRRPRR